MLDDLFFLLPSSRTCWVRPDWTFRPVWRQSRDGWTMERPVAVFTYSTPSQACVEQHEGGASGHPAHAHLEQPILGCAGTIPIWSRPLSLIMRNVIKISHGSCHFGLCGTPIQYALVRQGAMSSSKCSSDASQSAIKAGRSEFNSACFGIQNSLVLKALASISTVSIFCFAAPYSYCKALESSCKESTLSIAQSIF